MEHPSRKSISMFDNAFRALHDERRELILRTGDKFPFQEVGDSRNSMMPHSVGTYAIRSAAVVEQMINGITVRLWDDPFEWTLPERLPAVHDVIYYFEEVESARIRGFQFFASDADLQKEIPAPVELKTLAEILDETITRSKILVTEAQTILSKVEQI